MVATRLSQRWQRCKDDRLLRLTRMLLLAAVALLGLSAAGTIEVTFTLQPSYGLLCLAAVTGLPWAIDGWLRMPRAVQVAAAALVVVYVIALLVGSPARLSSQNRGGELRSLVYLADLGLGLTIVGLLCGVWTRAYGSRLLVVFCFGAAMTAAIAMYQWVALRFGLPLSDINSAPNSDGFTTGHQFQGIGLFGWERARGTFKEPLVLGSFCVMALPLALVAVCAARGWARWAATACAGLVACALALTVSSLSVGLFIALGISLALFMAMRDGRVALSGGLAAIVVLGLVTGPMLLSNPSALSGPTGRSSSDLKLTADNRKVAWRAAADQWEARPALGYGPGQSSVRLAYRPDPRGVGRTHAPVVLGSAQGIWAASLVDAGILGFCAWIGLFASLLTMGLKAGWHERGPLVLLLCWSAATAVALSNFTGDRVDIRAWLALGVLAAASQVGGRECKDPHKQSQYAATERPPKRVGPDLSRG